MNASNRHKSILLLSIVNFLFFNLLAQVTLPFSYDLGKPSNVLGLSASYLGPDYTSSPKIKFDAANGYLIINIASAPGTLSYTLRWNQGSSAPRYSDEFELLESDNGSLYTLVQAYNASSGTPLENGKVIVETISTLKPTTRFLKWLAVSKSNGIIGLGNINIGVGINTPNSRAATSVSSASFTANWDQVSTATGYIVDVYTKEPKLVTTTKDLIISEYVEGSSDNKFIEIYNGTGADVDLSDYKFQCYLNGNQTPTNNVQLTGTLQNGQVITFRNSNATLDTSPITSTVCGFNGNDAVALYKISTGAFVDIFGRIGEDPGTAWGSGQHSTVDKTLRRKSTVMCGISQNPELGFPTLTTEWDVFEKDNVSNLNQHSTTGTRLSIQNTPILNSPFLINNNNTTSLVISNLTSSTYYYTVKSTVGNFSTSPSSEVIVNTNVLLTTVNNGEFIPCVYASKGRLYMKGESEFQLFDLLGNLVAKRQDFKARNSIAIKSGIYVVKTATYSSKIVVE